ncbi:ArnT family glycosyltransferase [Algoriphagus resistens]|uniref:ArnT family glycosyltransferase n=1 Tax=Algoriphagus resistens TaxID=1750590 RepID=UPI0007168FB2|nr:glycosyltransferase family 39 protein [Algoriphagus resistens]
MKWIEHRWIALVFMLLAMFIHFAQLGAFSIYILDEAKNATAGYEMWKSSGWILPTFNGQPRYDKPPLHYFFFGLAYQFFGVTPFAARFFPALMGWLTVCLIYFTTERNFGRLAALASGLAMLASVHWVIQFHLAVPDPFLIFFLTASLLFFVRFWDGNHRKKVYLRWMGLTLGLAVLSKGPIAIALAGGTVLLFLLCQKGGFWNNLKLVMNPSAILIFLLVALPWYFLIAWKTDGVWIQEFLFKHNLNRFAAPMEGHGGGFYLTFMFVVVGMVPGSLLIITSFKSLIAYSHIPTLVKISLLFSCLTIVFFMLSGTKLPNYTAPVYPFLAIIIGWLLRQSTEWSRIKWPGLLALILLFLLPIGVYFGLTSEKDYAVYSYISYYFAPGSVVALVSGFYWFRRRWMLHWCILCIGFILVSLSFLYLAFPELDRRTPVIASNVKGFKDSEFYYFRQFNPSFAFALKKEIKDLENLPTTSTEGIVILRKSNLDEFEKLGFYYETIFEGRDLFETPTTVLLVLKPDPSFEALQSSQDPEE